MQFNNKYTYILTAASNKMMKVISCVMMFNRVVYICTIDIIDHPIKMTEGEYGDKLVMFYLFK